MACSDRRLTDICSMAEELTRINLKGSSACARVAELYTRNDKEGAKDRGADTCYSMLSSHVPCSADPNFLENNVEPSIPPLLYTCSSGERSQTSEIENASYQECGFESPMPEARRMYTIRYRIRTFLTQLEPLVDTCVEDIVKREMRQ